MPVDRSDGGDHTVAKRKQRRTRKSPTISDVAREAGVSTASVSRVLNRIDPVSPELVKAVEEATERLGFRINWVARSLRVNSTQTIGVVVPNITYPFFPQLVQALEVHLRERGFGLLLADSLDDVQLEAERVDALLNREVDGLIIAPCQYVGSREIVQRAAERVPVVQIDRQSCRTVPYVGLDQADAMRQIVEHLRGAGRTQLAFLGGQTDNGPARERRRSYAQCVAGTPAAGRIVLGDFTPEYGAAGALRIMEAWPEVDAIVCGNDLIALGALQGLARLSKSVPADVAITGYDDTPYATFGLLQLTTIRQPLARMTVEAVSQLLSTERRLTTVLPAELVVRESTGGRTVPTAVSP